MPLGSSNRSVQVETRRTILQPCQISLEACSSEMLMSQFGRQDNFIMKSLSREKVQPDPDDIVSSVASMIDLQFNHCYPIRKEMLME